MSRSILLGIIAFMIGCQESAETRFKHAAIKRTIAPWDGPAIQLILSELPLVESKKPTSPRISICIYRMVNEKTGRKFKLEGNDLKKGSAEWVEKDGQATELKLAEIEFDEVRDGTPVEGSFLLGFPDGSFERGRFRADWWKGEGPGG